MCIALAIAAAVASTNRQSVGAPISGKTVNAVLKVVSVLSSAMAAEEFGVNLDEFWRDTIPPGHSVYSVRFAFNRSSWADFWTDPDVFVVVECEGVDRVLVPTILNNWNGDEAVFTFRCPTLPSGRHCVLRLMDDDSLSDAVWRGVLSSTVRWKASLQPRVSATLPGSGVEAMLCSFGAKGDLQILNPKTSESVEIDSPESVAIASFHVPTAEPSDQWKLEGTFIDRGAQMGSVTFTHWRTNHLSRRWDYFLSRKFLFWAVIAGGLIVLLAPWNRIIVWAKSISNG